MRCSKRLTNSERLSGNGSNSLSICFRSGLDFVVLARKDATVRTETLHQILFLAESIFGLAENSQLSCLPPRDGRSFSGLFVRFVALTSWGDIPQRDCEKHIKEEIHPGTSLEIAEATLKECGFKMTVDPAKKTLYGDKRVGSLVEERAQVLINLDSGDKVATVTVTTGLIGP